MDKNKVQPVDHPLELGPNEASDSKSMVKKSAMGKSSGTNGNESTSGFLQTGKPAKEIGPQGCHKTCKPKVNGFLQHWAVATFMFSVTLFALFGDDLRQVVTDKDGDDLFYNITTVCMGFFIIEIALTVYGDPEYLWSFFFWLDVLSTATLVFDIGWMKNAILGTGGGSGAKDAGQLARAAKSSKVGARAARIVRIVRLIRLIRIVKLYKASQSTDPEVEKRKKMEKEADQRDKADKLEELENERLRAKGITVKVRNSMDDLYCEEANPADAPKPEKSDEKDPYQETNVGKKLSNRTTKRVILFVLSIMCCIPVYSTTTYKKTYTAFDSGVKNLYFWIKNETVTSFTPTTCCTPQFNAAFNEYWAAHNETRTKLLYMKLATASENEEVIYKSKGNPNDHELLRGYETKVVTSSSEVHEGNWFIIAYFSIEADSNLNGWFGLFRTVFTCILITLVSGFFSSDANELVLAPIESMLDKVKKIAKNPLSAAKIEEDDAIATEALKKMDKKLLKKKLEFDSFETTILEKTIVRIGALLSLGFGDEGSKVIARNMEKSGEVDAMIPGIKTVALFVYCDIRHFDAATEVLQEDVMQYVNHIAEIIHSRTDYFRGAANKNVGDAFLIVWKYEDHLVHNNHGIMSLDHDQTVVQTNELAILSLAKTQADLKKAKSLEKYRNNEKLQEKSEDGVWDVRIQMGMHIGWAIEGAIGSEYKIEASYISPNVTMTAKIEDLCKPYGVLIMICNSVVEHISDVFKNELRMIDRVLLKGDTDPIELYTIDLKTDMLVDDPSNMTIDKLSGLEKKQFKINNRCRREIFMEKLNNGKRTLHDCWKKDADIKNMCGGFKPEFYTDWNVGIGAYIQGDWKKAKVQFQKTVNFIADYTDVPSQNMIAFIDENMDTDVHKNWPGFREIVGEED